MEDDKVVRLLEEMGGRWGKVSSLQRVPNKIINERNVKGVLEVGVLRLGTCWRNSSV